MPTSSRPFHATLALLLFCGLALAPGAAGKGTWRAVLTAGPAAGRGLSFIPPNGIEYLRGEYRIEPLAGKAEGTAPAPIAVYAFRGAAIPFPGFGRAPCTSLPLYEKSRAGGKIACARISPEWAIALECQTDSIDPCLFLPAFAERFLYFLARIKDGEAIPLPAFILF